MICFVNSEQSIVRMIRNGAEITGPWPPEVGEWQRWVDEALAAFGEPAPYQPPLEPVPEIITDRQFFQGLAGKGLCTEAEALAAVRTGALPTKLEGFVGNLPADQQFPARMILSGATNYYRSSPLTEAFATMQGMSAADTDAFWRYCAAL